MSSFDDEVVLHGLETEDYSVPVEPIMYRETRGKEYETEYIFKHVHMDFDPDECLAERAAVRFTGDGFFYKYPKKEPVFVTQSQVYAREGSQIKEAENQAYFVLSFLDSAGYVSRFSKK